MTNYIQAIVTVLSLINPAVCASIFNRGESDQSRAERYEDAAKAALAVAIILVIAALLGTRILRVFGLSLEAFMVAGSPGTITGVITISAAQETEYEVSETALIAIGVATLVMWGVLRCRSASAPNSRTRTAWPRKLPRVSWACSCLR